MKRDFILLLLLLVSGCSAIPLNTEAKSVKLVLLAPNSPKCKYLGEVTSSDGRSLLSWSSMRGGYSTHETLVKSAKNKLRNKTYLMGGNLVYMKEIQNPNEFWDAMGGIVVKLVASGKAYRCDKDFDFHNPE